MLPSFLNSTLSLMAFISLLAVIAMIFLWVDPDEKLIGLISWVVWAYIGSRNPNTKTEEQHAEATMSHEEENLLATKYWDYGSNW